MQTPLAFVEKTAFDKAMDKLWQDFVAGSPIGGGMLFEKEVRSCTLNDSVESLKSLDRLLLAVKKYLAQNNMDENDLLRRAEFRHFVLFLAGYVGRVLTKASGNPISWRNLDELTALHRLDVSAGKFFTAMAVTFVDKPLPPIFVLVVIGAKLFGSFERPFKDPVSHDLATESLYRLAVTSLEKMGINTSNHKASVNEVPHRQTIAQTPPTAHAPMTVQTQTAEPQIAQKPSVAPISPTVQTPASSAMPRVSLTADLSHHSPKQSFDQPTNEPSDQLSNKTLSQPSNQVVNNSPNPPLNKPSVPLSNKKLQKPIKKDEFNEVKQDLINLPAIATPHDEHYQKAKAMLDKITAAITQNGQTLDTLSDDYKRAIAQAVGVLEKVANAGNTNAMLLLAIVHYDGILLANNPTAVFDWTKKSADANDIRGQKLLSRLYYQGIGTNPSVATGQFWLEKSATGGHPEAKKLQNQLEMIAMMKEDQHAEKQKDKKLYMVLGATGVALIVALWLLAKFAG